MKINTRDVLLLKALHIAVDDGMEVQAGNVSVPIKTDVSAIQRVIANLEPGEDLTLDDCLKAFDEVEMQRDTLEIQLTSMTKNCVLWQARAGRMGTALFCSMCVTVGIVFGLALRWLANGS